MNCHVSFARRAQHRNYKAGSGGLPDASAVFTILDTNVMIELAAIELAYQRKNPNNQQPVAQAFLRADKPLPPILIVAELLRTRQIFTAAQAPLQREWENMIADTHVHAPKLVGTDPSLRKAFVKRIQSKCLPLDELTHARLKCTADPDDQMLLDTAQAARRAGYTKVVILSHDHHLHDMKPQLEGFCHVMTPQEFVRLFPQIAPQKDPATSQQHTLAAPTRVYANR